MEDLQDKIIELMDLFDDQQVTTADKIDPPKNPYKEFEERNPMAGGGRIGFSTGTDKKNFGERGAKKITINGKDYRLLTK